MSDMSAQDVVKTAFVDVCPRCAWPAHRRECGWPMDEIPEEPLRFMVIMLLASQAGDIELERGALCRVLAWVESHLEEIPERFRVPLLALTQVKGRPDVN